MSYVDQGMSTGRIWSIVLVALLHALLGYAFVTGLAYKFVKNVQEDLKTFDVTEEPPPPRSCRHRRLRRSSRRRSSPRRRSSGRRPPRR